MTDPVRFFREEFVELFNRGVSVLDRRATESERARSILEDVRGARGAALLRFEGGGDVWLRVEEGRMSAPDGPPEDLPLRLAVALPLEAASFWVAQLEEGARLEGDEAAVRAARSASKRVEEAVGDEPLELHLVIRETPDFEEVRVRIGLGPSGPPDEPRFTATVQWDDLAAMRESGQGLQQLFMQGRLKLGGDYSRAMQLGMQLMQNPL